MWRIFKLARPVSISFSTRNNLFPIIDYLINFFRNFVLEIWDDKCKRMEERDFSGNVWEVLYSLNWKIVIGLLKQISWKISHLGLIVFTLFKNSTFFRVGKDFAGRKIIIYKVRLVSSAKSIKFLFNTYILQWVE